MAFYQMNRVRLSGNVALVSLGGTFSDRQITGVMNRFPHARAFDCFDNDMAGRICGLRLMALLENIPMKITRTDGGLQVEAMGKTFGINPERSLSAQVSGHLPLRYRMGQWLPPKAYKDWNDCLLNKPIVPVLGPNKNDRDVHLAEQRKDGMKF